MRIPDTTVVAGNTIDLPIYNENSLTGQNVLSYMLQLNFNQAYFQIISVITTGTISAPFGNPTINTSIPGRVTIAGAGTSSLTGQGKFILIRFKALQPGGTWVSFTGPQYNYFNEGIPAMSFDDGYTSISAPPSISTYPDNGLITKGEQMQFYVSGGTAPFQYYVTNSSVANISQTGLLTGTNQGFTKVVAQDNNGLRDTTNSFIEIRAMRLSIPTDLVQYQGRDIDVPVNTTDLTGLNIYSGNLQLSFNQNILTPVSVVQTGTLLLSYPAPAININTPGTISVAFAGSTPLTGSGTLVYIKFHVSLQNNGGTAINFVNGYFNESILPNFTNGYFSVLSLPVLSISPNSGSIVAPNNQQFTLNGGGIPPIQWSISDSSVATINQNGLMTAKKGGYVTISATDNLGASVASGNWLVYDTQITLPDTSICPITSTFNYPIQLGSLPPGESVNSIQATVTYNSSILTFQSLETSGTLTQGWTYNSNPTLGQVIFAGAGSSSFNTPGNILNLKFSLNPGFTSGTSGYIHLNSIMLNEGVPSPLVDINGSITGSNSVCPPPNISVNPDSYTKTVPQNGSADDQLIIENTGGLNLSYTAQVIYQTSHTLATVYPISANYNTGTTTISSKTQNSLVKGYPTTEVGWMKFDLSSIPDGSTINSVEFHGYVNATHYPFWNINPVSNDPVTASSQTLYNDIKAESGSGYYLYRSETGSFSTGWKSYLLGGNSNSDLQLALLQNWFAIGIMDRDGSSSYYIGFDGWNESHKPYLVIDYTPPYNWLKVNNSNIVTGNILPGNENQLTVGFDASSLELGVYMANIRIISNDPTDPQVLIPCTLNIMTDHELNLTVFLEGLYNGDGMMRSAQDESGDHFAEKVADQIIVELHDAAHYSNIVFVSSGIDLNTDGSVNLMIPATNSGSYYLTIKHRNSIETTSASPVLFNQGSINYDFDSPSKAYGGNMLQMNDGRYVIYGGDVNQDGKVDFADMDLIKNVSSVFGKGYFPQDINGDGFIDMEDMIIVDNNAATMVIKNTP